MAVRARRWAAVLVPAVAVALLAGCGAGPGSAGAPIVRPAATRAAVDDGPFGGLTVAEIRQQSVDAMTSLSSMTVTLTAVQNGVTFHLKLLATDEDRCAMAMDEQFDQWRGIAVGDMFYVKADDTFWRHHGRKDTSPATRGKWVRMPADYNPYTSVCDVTHFGEHSSENKGGTWTTGRESTLDGGPALAVVHRTAERTDTFWIAETGPPYVLRSVTSGKSPSRVTYSGFDQTARISVPAADQTVDLDDLADLDGSAGPGDDSDGHGAFSV